MVLFSRRKSPAPPAIPAFPSSTSLAVSSPGPLLSSGGSSRSVSRPSSPLPPQAPVEIITLKVAIDPYNEDRYAEILHVNVRPDESVAALRREISRTVGHGSMGLFKVSIPLQAHDQVKTYTAYYGKHADLFAHFPAFNLDDPRQLPLSFPSYHRREGAIHEASKVGHWFPNHRTSEVIDLIARPLKVTSMNAKPLSLRVYLATPSSATRSLAPIARPTPLIVDVDPYTTVDELKMILLSAAEQNPKMWKNVVLWQIAMTESEMIVIDELGRLRNGKMPWPYPPGAMEPVPLSDGSLPISLFFPRSAPDGDMLNLSMWFCPPSITSIPSASPTVPPFRYPMSFPQSIPSRNNQPSSSMSTGSSRVASYSPTAGAPLPVTEPSSISRRSPLKSIVTIRRGRPSTAPTVLVSDTVQPLSTSMNRTPPTRAPPPPPSHSPTLAPSFLLSPARPPLDPPSRPKKKGVQGLGIAIPPSSRCLPSLEREELRSRSSSELEPEDADVDTLSLPSFTLSQGNLSSTSPREVNILKTPETDVAGVYWAPSPRSPEGASPGMMEDSQKWLLLSKMGVNDNVRTSLGFGVECVPAELGR